VNPPDVSDGLLDDARHTGLTVANLDRSIAFYRDLLGMTLVSLWEGDAAWLATVTGFAGARLRIAWLRANPTASHGLELLEYLSHPTTPVAAGTNRPGSAHVCFGVPDIAALHERLSAAGVEFVSPPVRVTEGFATGMQLCYFRDPDGFTIEVIQRAG